jgi:hypothetical protein
MTMANATGGCLCGRVRYTLSGDPVFSGICHCRSCQRYTGTTFEAVAAYPASAVTVEGELKAYQDTGDSGKSVFRKFCPNCGSGVLAEVEVMPDMVLVLVGTLDDVSTYQPSMEIYCGSAQPWFHGSGERKRFAAMPG